MIVMRFDSLQSYLEFCFKNTDIVTESMIKSAKEDYRKMYLSRYYKTYRENFIQVTFRVSKKQFVCFSKQAENENLKVITYIKQLALIQKENRNISKLKFQLLQIRDILEEAVEEDETVNVSELLSLTAQMLKQLS
jgi:hypothetical protein